MTVYVRIEPGEEKAIKKAILEAMASSVRAQDSALKLSKLKAGKKAAVNDIMNMVQKMSLELENIKKSLPETEFSPRQKPEAAAMQSAKPAKSGKKKTRYESELEAIKEKIAQL